MKRFIIFGGCKMIIEENLYYVSVQKCKEYLI